MNRKEPRPLCYAHGCMKKAIAKCEQCGNPYCSTHNAHQTLKCADCGGDDGGEVFFGESNALCPYCGRDECDCHDIITGFLEGGSKD